jgi:hypothetical protein
LQFTTPVYLVAWPKIGSIPGNAGHGRQNRGQAYAECPDSTPFAAYFRLDLRPSSGHAGTGRVEVEMTATAGAEPGQSQDDAQHHGWLREQINLDIRYGKIGISAVAAALRYSGVTKNPACTPAVAPQIDERFQELAA